MSRRLSAVWTPPEDRRDAPAFGAIIVIIGIAFVAVAHAAAKQMSGEVHVAQIILIRSVIAGGLVLGILGARGKLSSVRFQRPSLHVVRSLCLLTSMSLSVYAVQYMVLVDATVLMSMGPIFITMLAALFLGETVGWRRWSAVAVGFCGMIVMLRPTGETLFDPVAILPIAGALAYAIGMVMTRRMASHESSVSMLLSLHLVVFIAAGAISLFVWIPPSLEAWGLMIATGVCAAVFSAAFTTAYSCAPASLIAPLDYTLLVWAALVGFVGWGETPDSATILGALLITGSGLFIAFRESRVAYRSVRPTTSMRPVEKAKYTDTN